jgi:tRNA-specific 2-thiouridylase
MSERILVAMSGGVDSSVAAALLQEQGYEVIGVTLHLWDYPDDGSVKGRCCAPEDVHDARRVADTLGFPHYAFDRRELFEREVVTPFVESYLSGTTPSPCVRCNRGVKIAELLALADRLGARQVATGHYARTRRVANGEGERLELHRARDPAKDQSYFLHMLPDAVLSRFVFPLGDMDKPSVRARAVELALPGANKGESQELCFVPTGRYDELVEKRAPERVRPGPIIGADGRVLGEHAGLHKFTRGQRRNLGVATGERSYVVSVDPATAAVRLGEREDLLDDRLEVAELSLRDGVELPIDAEAVIRYRGRPVPARIERLDESRALVSFSEPVQAPSLGQYAVFYAGDRVLGGGLIVRVGGARA